MGEIREIDYNLPINNFTDANGSSNIPSRTYDFARNVNKSRKRRREFNYLNKTNNHYLNSNVPVVDLTGNNGQFVNRRIPVIDLTDGDVMEITDQIQCIDLTNDDSSGNNFPNRHFELKRKMASSSNNHHFEIKRKLDSSSTSRPTCNLELPRNDFLIPSQLNRHLELTRNSNSLNNSQMHHFELTSNDNSLNSSQIDHHFNLTKNGDSSSNSHLEHHFELTRNGDSSNNSHLEHQLELTRNGDSSNNSHLEHPFEHTSSVDSSSNGYPNNQFELASNDDCSNNSYPNHHEFNKSGIDINRSSECFSMAGHDIQNFNQNMPASALTYDDKFMNYRRPDMGRNNEQNITHTLLNTVQTDNKQRSVNNRMPTTFTYDIGQSIDQTIPPIFLTFSRNYENYGQPIFDQPPKNNVNNTESLNSADRITKSSDTMQKESIIREPIDIAGMYEAEVRSCNNLPTRCPKDFPEINTRIPLESSRYDLTAFNILKFNEASNVNFMQIKTSDSMQQHQCREEAISKNSHPQINSSHQKNVRSMKYKKVSQNSTSDLLKPASHPIPFRHSLGRSTVNTSKNVPIESSEAAKGDSQTTTVSSTIRRKKVKSTGSIHKQNLSNSLEPVSRAWPLSFGAVKEFFLKFFILFIFIWIVHVFLWYFIGF